MTFSMKALSLALLVGVASSASSSLDTTSFTDTDISGGSLPTHHPPVRSGTGTGALHPTLAKFSSQFRCPYAKEWLAKGAHQAAIDLGLTTPDKIEAAFQKKNDLNNNDETNNDRHQMRRRAQESSAAAAATAIMGSCSFNSPWSGPSCIEFRGDGWTSESMTERCAVEPDSTLAAMQGDEGCPTPSELAGWCVKEASTTTSASASASSNTMMEASSMMISAMSDCDGNKMACETFVGGVWEAAAGGACGGGAPATTTDYANMGPPSMDMGDTSCMIAPGAIGAAHQAGFSSGYSSTCQGTPAEGSPYMWPLKWSADIDTQAMGFGNDDVVFRNKGRVFYRLDNNWKRMDTTYSKGTRRGVGQGPCDSANIDTEQSEDGIIACNIDTDVEGAGSPMTTMIHRGSKMYFITWKANDNDNNNTDNNVNVKVGETDPSLIAECNYMDLMVVGNIRPDWFLDNRGDDTDVQYLGDQHVYHADGNLPRLVKQWRKKDFANQYFTMSIAGNLPNSNKNNKTTNNNTTPEDSVRWPLVLNIPGEGFGDDMLQVYKNHTLLKDNGDDDDLFLLIENLEASGGSCPLLTTGMGPDGTSSGGGGPPTTDVLIPSNLEIDPNSWVSNMYTFSPVWIAPMKLDDDDKEVSTSGGGDIVAAAAAVTEAGRVRVESCYDPSSKSVELSIEFMDIKPISTTTGFQLPWMSLGYRINEVCSMNPPDGSDSKIVMVLQSPNNNSNGNNNNSYNNPKAYAGSLISNAKNLDATAISSVYESLWPLEKTVGYSDVSLSVPPMFSTSDSTSAADPPPAMIERASDGLDGGGNDSSNDSSNNDSSSSVTLKFKQQFDEKPEVMHLMYAIGMSAQLGVHISRSCFDVVEFPTCSSGSAASSTDAAGLTNNDEPSSTTTSTSSLNEVVVEESTSSSILSIATIIPGVVVTTAFLSSTFFLS